MSAPPPSRGHSGETLQRIAFGAGILAVALFSVRAVPEFLVSSDHYYLPRLAADLFRDHGRLADWILISAPRFFPDMLLYFFSYQLFGGHLRSLQFASYLLIALQFAAVALSCQRIDGRGRIAIVAGLSYLAFCILLGSQAASFAYVAWHSGTFAIIWLCAYLVCATDVAGRRALAAAALAALVVASNVLAIPLLASGMIGWWIARVILLRRFDGDGLLQVAAVAGGCALGMAAYYLLLPNPFSNPVNASNLSLRAAFDVARLVEALTATVTTLAASRLFLAAAVLGALAVALLPTRSGHRRAMLELLAFWLAACLANEFLMALGTWQVDRYRIMPVFGCAAIASIGIAVIVGRFALNRWFPLLVLTPLVALGSRGSSQAFDQTFLRLVAEANCLGTEVRRHGLRQGVSDFFTANRFSVLSGGTLRLVAIRGKSALVPAAMVSRAWLRRKPDYVVADREHDPGRYETKEWVYPLSRELALEHFGPPQFEHGCDSKVLLIYRQGIDVLPPRH